MHAHQLQALFRYGFASTFLYSLFVLFFVWTMHPEPSPSQADLVRCVSAVAFFVLSVLTYHRSYADASLAESVQDRARSGNPDARAKAAEEAERLFTTSARYLWASIFAAMVYIHLVVSLTMPDSPFLHFYLYLPAIVLITTANRRAEVLASMLVTVSLVVNLAFPDTWHPWRQVLEAHWKHSSLVLLTTVVLLVLLCRTNRELEGFRVVNR
jgi:hypothetical protein